VAPALLVPAAAECLPVAEVAPAAPVLLVAEVLAAPAPLVAECRPLAAEECLSLALVVVRTQDQAQVSLCYSVLC
jgi:hypothetical protein